MRFLRLFWFHLKLYASNQYFFWLTLSSTASVFLLQYVMAYATHNLSDPNLWVRSGVFGLWSSATTAAGAIGFQRYQGTLRYITNTRIDNRLSLAALLLPAASFGLLAFPVAYGLAVLLKTGHTNLSWHLVLVMGLLWVAAALMDQLIATFFVLTVNAIVYEELITIPLLLLSGLFGSSPLVRPLLNAGEWVIPIAVPVNRLLNEQASVNWLGFLCSLALWTGLTLVLSGRIMRIAKQTGSAGVM